MKKGNKLYKYYQLGNYGEYECVGVIDRENTTLFEIKCKTCNHAGENCKVLIKEIDEKKYDFVSMVNNEDHKAFHKVLDEGGEYYETEEKMRESLLDETIKKKKSTINSLKNKITDLEKDIEELREAKNHTNQQ